MSNVNASDDHKELINITSNYFKTKINKEGTCMKGKYLPDLKNEDTDFECELLKRDYIKKKIDRWDKTRNKVLIIGFPKLVEESFDEIYIYDLKGSLIKIR